MDAAVRMLAAALDGPPPASGRFWRVSAEVPAVAPLEWLAAQREPVRLYWSARDDEVEIAAVGVADWRQTRTERPGLPSDLRAALAEAPAGLRYYGGMRFDPARPPGPGWDAFGTALFILPRIELIRPTTGPCRLVVNAVRGEHSAFDTAACLRALETLEASSLLDFSAVPAPVRRVDTPGYGEWPPVVDEALRRIHHGSLDKVVLARESRYAFDEPIDAMTLLARLRDTTLRSFHFALQLGADTALLGASPERLYERQGRNVASEAVAGTRPRGATENEDLELADALLQSDKDRREHAFVVQAIRDALGGLCTHVSGGDDRTLLRLRRCQHLYCRLEGTLRNGVTDADLLAALHPTPAVGGVPTQAAVAAIGELEAFDRGWYTGPIGWVSRDAAEFAVAIRLGLLRGPELTLYSGAGIVPGSSPFEEWAEIENKIGHFTAVLCGDSQ